METGLLKAFVAVAGSKSFSLAARELHLSQPAVSKRIAQLEQHLDVRLFDRGGTIADLTESGRLLLQGAEKILAEITHVEQQVRSMRNEVSGRLRISTSHHIGIHRLPPVLREYCAQYPKVELDLLFQDSEVACDDVLAGSLELAIVTLPDKLPDSVISEQIWPDPLAIVVPEGHPLLGETRPDVPTLLSYPAVLPAIGTVTRTILEQALSSATRGGSDGRLPRKPGVSLETNYLETIKMMVTVGLGWSLLPHSMLTPELVAVNISGLNMQRSLGTVRQRHRSLTRAAESFLMILNSHACHEAGPIETI